MSAQELMEQLTVAPDVRDAVIHRRGTLGGLLALAEMVESGKEGNLDSMLSWADEGAAQEVSDITAEAAAWAVAEFGV
jgi:c-di-GMP-related signal transduction protein